MKKLYFFIFVLCILSVSGCSSLDDDGIAQKISEDSIAVKNDVGNNNDNIDIVDNKPESKSLELSKPNNIYLKQDNPKKMYLTWDRVSDADYYEIEYGNGQTLVSKVNSCGIDNIQEGYLYAFRVRAVHEEKNHVDYSDWAESKTFEIAVNLAMPKNIEKDLDGSYIHICWEAVEGATGYEVKWNSNSNIFDTPGVDLTGVEMGENIKLYIRSVKNVETRFYYSDWAEFSYTVPTIDYSKIDYDEATLLNYNQLLEWVKTKGYDGNITTEDWDGTKMTVVDVYCEDVVYKDHPIVALGAKALAVGKHIYEQVDLYTANKLDEDYASVLDTTVTLFQSKGFKNYINELNKEAEEEGQRALVKGVWRAIITDTKMHYYYYYDNTDLGAIVSINKFIHHTIWGDEHDKKYSKYKKDSDGYYSIVSKMTGQDYRVKVDDVKENGMVYWFVQVDNCRKR